MTIRFNTRKIPFDTEGEIPTSPKQHSQEVQDLAAIIEKAKGLKTQSPLEELSPNKREREFKSPQPGLIKKATLPTPSSMKNWGIENATDPTPPTPMAARITPRRHLASPAESPYKRVYNELESGIYNKTTCVEKIGEGSYCSVYEVQDELVLPRVIKAFHGKKTDFFERSLNDYRRQSLENYNATLSLHLPVAKIYNEKTVFVDRVIVQEMVPHPVDPSIHLPQVQLFFTASVKNDVMMDLQPDNFRARADGTVVLIDFVEEDDQVLVFINKACKAWIETCSTHEEAEARLRFLTAGFLNQFEGYDEQWLNELLGTEPKTPDMHGTGAL